MNNPQVAKEEQFGRIFFPHASKRFEEARNNGTRFVHYTSADAAIRILQTKEVWMRNSSCMNDFMEVQYGLNCLERALKGKAGDRFKSALNRIFAGIIDDIKGLFDTWTPHFQTDTYLTCVSEHRDDEDAFGRLSMWRAYGETTGVALVIKNSLLLGPYYALKVYASPVTYTNDLQGEIGKIADNISEQADFIRAQARDEIVGRVFSMLRFAALCTKHPGFAEEQEWRVIYCPSLEKSRHMIPDVQVVKGVPQPICKIPLKNIPEEAFVGAEVSELIDKIIVGPTQYPIAIWQAFFQALDKAGVSEPGSRLRVSDIPLRR